MRTADWTACCADVSYEPNGKSATRNALHAVTPHVTPGCDPASQHAAQTGGAPSLNDSYPAAQYSSMDNHVSACTKLGKERYRLAPLETALQCTSMSSMVTGRVVSWPCTTIATLSPTSRMSMPAVSTWCSTQVIADAAESMHQYSLPLSEKQLSPSGRSLGNGRGCKVMESTCRRRQACRNAIQLHDEACQLYCAGAMAPIWFAGETGVGTLERHCGDALLTWTAEG